MRATVVATIAVVLLAAGCGGSDGDQRSDGSDEWRASAERAETSGLAWAEDSTVHLSDGTRIDAGGHVRSFVVAGGGVFFLPLDGGQEAGESRAPGELRFAAAGQPVIDTGITVSPTFMAASPDGRYLSIIDTESGEKDDFGTPQATMLVFDLESGEQVVASTMGMGDPDSDDFADLYSELEMKILSSTDTEVYVRAEGTFVFDLATGEGREVADEPEIADDLVSPDGRWRIEKPDRGRDRIVDADGREVALDPGAPDWFASWWADATTVVGGVGAGRDGGRLVGPVRLMTCVVPGGKCRVFDETSGVPIVLPVGFRGPAAITLPDEESS